MKAELLLFLIMLGIGTGTHATAQSDGQLHIENQYALEQRMPSPRAPATPPINKIGTRCSLHYLYCKRQHQNTSKGREASHKRHATTHKKKTASVHHSTVVSHIKNVAGPHRQVPVIRYRKGQVKRGYVTNVYDTNTKKSTLPGFWKIVPVRYQKPVWVQIVYDKGAHRTIAIVPKGFHVRKGDDVKIVFGTRHPPSPNKVVRIMHMRKTVPYSSKQGINRHQATHD
jgi:hypothetical protein